MEQPFERGESGSKSYLDHEAPTSISGGSSQTETIKIYKEIQLKIKNTNILITHKPQNKNKRLFDINIHGHHHKKLLPKRFLQDYYYNVAVEHNYYKPKLLIDIIKNKGICTKGIDIDEIIGQILYNNKKNLVFA